MSLALDLLTALIVLAAILFSAKKGFARVVMDFAAFLVSLGLAFFLSGKVADVLYRSFFKSALLETVANNLQSAADGTLSTTGVLSHFLGGIFQGKNQMIDVSDILARYSGNAQQAVSEVTDRVAGKVIISFLSVILFIFLFLLLRFILGLVVRLVDKAFKIPVVGALNACLGGALGLVKGVLIVLLLSFFLKAYINYGPGNGAWITQKEIDQTTVFHMVYDANCLGLAGRVV